MRYLFVVFALVLAPPVFGQQNDAEKLFRSMERKVRDAKVIKIVFETNVEMGKDGGEVKGAVHIADGNKIRLETSGTVGGKETSMTIVADGKHSLMTQSGMPKQTPVPVEGHLSAALPQIIARGGIFAALEYQMPKSGFDIDKEMPISDWKLGKKEKIGFREAQSIDCTVKPGNGKIIQMTTWLDTKTTLPVKRILVGPGSVANSTLRVVEVYTEITFNPRLDGRIFELPK